MESAGPLFFHFRSRFPFFFNKFEAARYDRPTKKDSLLVGRASVPALKNYFAVIIG